MVVRQEWWMNLANKFVPTLFAGTFNGPILVPFLLFFMDGS